MSNGFTLFCLLAALAGLPAPAPAQAPQAERGRTRIEYFELSVLGATDYNYGITQDPEGRIWVANERPLLSYDGVRWRAFATTDNRTGSHSPLARDGRIYGSGTSDLGYFEEDSKGDFAWHSLNALLPESARVFGQVAGPVATHDALWYLTDRHLICFGDDGSVQLADAAALESTLTAVNDAVYVVDSVDGLKVVKRDASDLILVPASGLDLDTRAAVTDVDLLADGSLAYLTKDRTLLRLDKGSPGPFAETLWPEFQARRLVAVLPLRDGGVALGFLRGGVWIVGPDGSLRERYDETSDSRIGSVSDLFEDRESGLWVSQVGGLARIDRGTGLTSFGIESGLAQALAMVRHEGLLYAAGRTGVFVLRSGDAQGAARFVRLQSGPQAAADIISRGGRLWMAGGAVVRVRFAADGNVLERDTIEGISQARRFAQSMQHPNRVYVISIDAAIDVLDDVDSERPRQRRIVGVSGTSSRIVVDPDETLWVNTSDGAVWRVRPDIAGSKPERFDYAHGLPLQGAIEIDALDIGMVVTTDRGLLRWDPTSARFAPLVLDGPLSVAAISKVAASASGDWFARGPEAIGVWRRGPTGHQWDAEALRALSPERDVHGFLREDDVLWIARSNGVERLSLASAMPAVVPTLLLTQVRAMGGPHDLPFRSEQPITFAKNNSDVMFSWALPIFSSALPTQYRTRLQGYDTQWSPWGTDTDRGYTNLPDGAFSFQAQARNTQSARLMESLYQFYVAPPWWHSIWAYFGYATGALAMLWAALRLGGRLRQRALITRQRELESVVDQRTQELMRSNEQLAEQAERLNEVDRLKTRFFINVGHEFRTPLTLVLGPIDDLLRDARERLSVRAREQLEMANRNARRVLDLIVELLDVNRFEHGKMRLTRAPTDLSVLAERVLIDQAPLLERHGHLCKFSVDGVGPWAALVDPPQIERCLSNLIGNAAKYMARGGLIELRLRRIDGDIEIAVVDQGRGIAAAALPHVYDRFFQTEGADSASGYGIGLALVREIIEAHQGRVAVHSVQGEGSTFLLMIPEEAAASAAPVFAPVAQTIVITNLSLTPNIDPDSTQRSGKPLVLVVDDHDDLRARARGLLEDRFEVIEAIDGPSAWNAARDNLPDVIVCDVMMPGFDGIELTRRLRADADTAAIALLLLTAKVGSDHAVAGLRAGADDYLAKPFDASELLARIDALHARAQRLRLRLVREQQPAPAPMLEESADQRWRRRLDELIAERMDDPELSIEQLAQGMHADRSQLFRKCKELVAMSPSEYLRDTRLKRGFALLEAAAGSISEIAYAVGFDSLSSFTRAFKVRYGHPPSQVAAARKVG
jgi:signal transduction histidine kinase/DNA-binding response OmpR family regulator/ligand-binding sensor domain-containing protein